MASRRHISGSEDSGDDLLQTPSTPAKKGKTKDSSPPVSTLSHRFRESSRKSSEQQRVSRDASEDKIAVLVAGPSRPWEYQPYRGNTTVDSVLEELEGPNGEIWYTIEYEDGKQHKISIDNLIKLRNGQNALDLFKNDDENNMSSPEVAPTRASRSRVKASKLGYVDTTKVNLEDTDEGSVSTGNNVVKKRRLARGRVSVLTENDSQQSSRGGSRVSTRLSKRTPVALADSLPSESSESGSEVEEELLPSHVLKNRTRTAGRSTRASIAKPPAKLRMKARGSDEVDELAGENEVVEDSEGSEIIYDAGKKKKKQLIQTQRARSQSTGKRGRPRKAPVSESSEEDHPQATRKSGRERQVKNMKEMDMDEEVYADEVLKNSTPKVISVREVYKPIPSQALFAQFHNKECDVCGDPSNRLKGEIIYCQGCSSSIHKHCLGYRSQREPIVTKVGDEDFVMQCRRCIGAYTKKDPQAPRLFSCQGCGENGKGCAAFSVKKTPKQEEKLRLENGGDDPVTKVSKDLINNAENLLFRCIGCYRTWHLEHLPPRSKFSKSPEDISKLREARLKEYTPNWQCKDCCEVSQKVQGLVAWRPTDRESYKEGATVEELREDEKEYLVKWDGRSYFACTWMSGGWVWGVTNAIMRKAFVRRDDGVNLLPKWTSEEAIPEAFLRMEIIFDVEYDDDYEPQTEEDDKANISAVARVLVKFLGLGYEESVWEAPPSPDEGERWSDFVSAYNEYIAGQYFKSEPTSVMNQRVAHYRTQSFKKHVQMKQQPASITGELMPYQLEGLNWLLYNFHKQKNVILADEMGLGKTIQIVSMVAALVADKPHCWPFLIVTPNSTCPNWRREFKKWAPDVRVVTYYGPKVGREMAMEYELFPDNCKDMRAHVVVTSYEGPVDDSSRPFFRKIKWAGMIVDEGQRLKNDENLLYLALKALKVPFQVLLTGTPLQNNKRELFNLLQFLDSSINAAELDEEYEELTNENIPKLHELIRPFFLRRTKVQVLKFLPPMAQVILPVSMSLVQKKLYKSILGKNPDLIRTILGANKTVVNVKERGNLNNILMQLRKCLCHPFVYSSAIEERSVSEPALYRNLVDASSKFQLLELMLPKLRERGHRVLLFSQFLNQLDLVEDFLNGLALPFQRLDGKINALEKQKRIDAFNAPDSELFAFLLSTRAGGVGINLATADTVIIMDPDFNPHQDLQALSRAHRIGQKKKVLVFQLMTKDSAEEKIVQIGRKKMALDQALIESMDAEDDAGVDLESILAHGAAALFNDDDRNDIRYDSASVDKLLDRSQVENTKMDEEKTAESQFSFARVWANEKGDLTEDLGDPDEEAAPLDPSVWENILKQREVDAAEEASRNLQTFGRGKRARHNIDYQRAIGDGDDDVPASSPPAAPAGKKKRRPQNSDEESDFGSAAPESDKDEESEPTDPLDPKELELPKQKLTAGGILKGAKSHQVYVSGKVPGPKQGKEYAPRNLQNRSSIADERFSGYRGQPPFVGTNTQNSRSHPHQQAQAYYPQPGYQPYGVPVQGYGGRNFVHGESALYCHACGSTHVAGRCPIKLAGAQNCGLCGLPHFGASFANTKCPHLLSDIKIRLMLDALAISTEPLEEINLARQVLTQELANPQRPRRLP